MAGSRLEKFGTIYKRVNGFLRSGALNPVDKPMWFDVYGRFPPKVEPLYERPPPSQDVRKIVYPEDIIRIEFYKVYGNPDVINLRKKSGITSCKLFVDKYIELLKSESDRENLFLKTAEALKARGLKLRTRDEIPVPYQKSTTEPVHSEVPEKFSVEDLFGKVPDKAANVFDDDMELSFLDVEDEIEGKDEPEDN